MVTEPVRIVYRRVSSNNDVASRDRAVICDYFFPSTGFDDKGAGFFKDVTAFALQILSKGQEVLPRAIGSFVWSTNIIAPPCQKIVRFSVTRPIFTGVSLLAAETNSLRWMQVERVYSKLQKTLSKIRNRLKRSVKEKLMEKQHPRQNTWGQTPQQQCSRSIVKKQRR